MSIERQKFSPNVSPIEFYMERFGAVDIMLTLFLANTARGVALFNTACT